jgi:vacuolar-type H+-ATPase subunit F/Vma7
MADEDTVLGFRYAGIDGTVAETPEGARRAFSEVLKDENVGVIIVTEQTAQTVSEEVSRIQYQSTRPVVVRIPGSEGPLPSRLSLEELIREAVGIKV